MAVDYTKYVGEKFGTLTVIKILGFTKEFKNAKRRRMQVLVQCGCGNEFPVFIQKLKKRVS